MFKRLLPPALLAVVLAGTTYAVFAVGEVNNGISVLKSPTPVSAEELVSAMGGSIWKLRITLPDGVSSARAEVRIRDKSGKSDYLIGSAGNLSFSYPDIVIAMLPCPDDTKGAPQKRFSIASAGGAAAGSLPDPFAGLNNMTRTNLLKEISPGVFELARASNGDPEKVAEKVLELHIIPNEPGK